jgi:hypothetical protein
VTDERRRCRCHGEPMDKTAASWECAVKRRARRLAAYHAEPASDLYARSRRRLRARIARKRQLIEEMENRVAEEDTC